MKIFTLQIAASLLASCSAFVSPTRAFTRQSQQHNMMNLPDSIYSASTTLATIDMDIAKLSDNEFAPIFFGGILVMFGGVMSALIVGFILEKGDLYASVVADSYVQSSDDEEFWKGLSEEERKKAQALIRKVKSNNNGEVFVEDEIVPHAPEMVFPSVAASAPTQPKKEKDMFSDYE
jgi:hypothetical protein